MAVLVSELREKQMRYKMWSKHCEFIALEIIAYRSIRKSIPKQNKNEGWKHGMFRQGFKLNLDSVQNEQCSMRSI